MDSSHNEKWFVFTGCLVFVVLGICILARGPVFVSDQFEIKYRRFFKWKKARWTELEAVDVVDRSGKNIVLHLLHDSGIHEIADVPLGWTNKHLSIAEQMLMNAIESRLKLQPDGNTTIDLLHNLAVIYWLQKRYSEALSVEEKALRICEESLGLDDPKTANTLLNLAYLTKEIKQNDRALDFSKRAAKTFEKITGTLSSDYAASLEIQGNALRSLGHREEAARAETSARKISKSIPKLKDHPNVVVILIHVMQIGFIGFLFSYPFLLNPLCYLARPISISDLDSVADRGQIVRINLRTTSDPVYVTPKGEKLALVMLELLKTGRPRSVVWTGDTDCTDESGKITLRCGRANQNYLSEGGWVRSPFKDSAIPESLMKYLNKDVLSAYFLELPCNANVVAYTTIDREADGSYRMNPPNWLPFVDGIILTTQDPASIEQRATLVWIFGALLTAIVASYCYGKVALKKLKQLFSSD